MSWDPDKVIALVREEQESRSMPPTVWSHELVWALVQRIDELQRRLDCAAVYELSGGL